MTARQVSGFRIQAKISEELLICANTLNRIQEHISEFESSRPSIELQKIDEVAQVIDLCSKMLIMIETDEIDSQYDHLRPRNVRDRILCRTFDEPENNSVELF